MAADLVIDEWLVYVVELLTDLTSFNWFLFLGSLEELVSSNEAVLKEKEQQARRLEDKEQELQKEVRSHL